MPIKSHSYISKLLFWHIDWVDYLTSSRLGLFLHVFVGLGLSPLSCLYIYVVYDHFCDFCEEEQQNKSNNQETVVLFLICFEINGVCIYA